jgi:hypothetical protein
LSRFIAGSIHRRVDLSQGRFIVGSIHRRVDSSQDRFITGSIHRSLNSLRVDSSQGRFIAGLIHLRVMSTENLIGTWNFLAGHTKLGSFCCKNFFVAARHHWKASFIEIYLIEMYNFWFEHENWVLLVVRSFCRCQEPMKN